jgi:release factor glutamine methyltransferase
LVLKEGEEFKDLPKLKQLLEKRCKERIPVQHLIGEWDCLGRTFKVLPKVLAPRPATELLIEHVLERIDKKPLLGLEIGTGTGCISINLLLENPNLKMVGVEIDPVAVENTIENAKNYSVLDRFEVIRGNIFEICEKFNRENRKFNFIVSNPPYIAEEHKGNLPPEVLYENPIALFGGEKGLKFYKFYAENCKRILKENGFLAVEFEPFQKPYLEKLFKEQSWKTEFFADFAGNYRVMIARPKGK